MKPGDSWRWLTLARHSRGVKGRGGRIALGKALKETAIKATKDIFILGGARTAMAEYVGHFKDMNANALGAHAIRAALERSGVPGGEIERHADRKKRAQRRSESARASISARVL